MTSAFSRRRPSTPRMSRWLMIPTSEEASIWRPRFEPRPANSSISRATVSAAPLVCSVANTRWPVSAARSAVSAVSSSRISPIRITSGSWRSAALSARANDGASAPISRCETSALASWWMNSIGSSTVTMWHERPSLMRRIKAAEVVLLPEPVGPVTMTRPCGAAVQVSTTSGRPSSSKSGASGIVRKM
jgi:hypothetical protein